MPYQCYRGPFATIPVLLDGQFGFTTDTQQLYVGYMGTNYLVGGSAGIPCPLLASCNGSNSAPVYTFNSNSGIGLYTDGTNLLFNQGTVPGVCLANRGRVANANSQMLDGLTGYAIYDNSGGGHTTISAAASTLAPNITGQVLRVSYDGMGTPTSNPTPGYGGFYIALGPAGGTNDGVNTYCYRQGGLYHIRIWASIPVGYTIQFATNSYGTGGYYTWLSSQAGTGDFFLYEALQQIGTSGTFDSTGFWYIDGAGTNTAFDWDVASCEMIGVNEAPNIEAAATLNVGYAQSAGLNFGDGLFAGNLTCKGGAFNLNGAILEGSANTLILVQGSNPQTFQIYNTNDGLGDAELLNIFWNGNVCYIATTEAGTGSPRPLVLGTFGAAHCYFLVNGTICWLFDYANGNFLPNADNTYDIGQTGNRPANLHLAGNLYLGGSTAHGVLIGEGTSAVNSVTISNKGSLLAGQASADPIELTVGSNGQVLTADSSQTAGIKWATPTTGTVTSVALTVPTGLSVSGSPITSSGTLAVTWSNETENTLLAGPTSGSAAAPTFRALVPADVNLTTKGDLLVTDGSSLNRLAVGSDGQGLLADSTQTNGVKWGSIPSTPVTVANGGTGDTSFSNTNQPILAGTTSTGALQSVTAGTRGQALTSNGGAAPTFQTAVLPGYVYGLNLTYTSTTTFTVGTGYATDTTSQACINNSGPVTITATGTGTDGLDVSTISTTVSTSSSTAIITGSAGNTFLSDFPEIVMTGTIASSSTTVTGTNTLFLSQLAIGDLIGNTTAGWTRVTAIASNTSCTTQTAGGFSALSTCERIENAWVQVNSQTVRQINAITSNTSITISANSSATVASGGTLYFGALPSGQVPLNVFIGQTTTPSTVVWLSTQRTNALNIGSLSYLRRIGSVIWTGSAFIPFTQSGGMVDRRYIFQDGDNANNETVVAAGTATSWTTFSVANLAPPSAHLVLFSAEPLVAGLGGTCFASLRPQGIGSSTTSRNQVVGLEVTNTESFPLFYYECGHSGGAIDYVIWNNATGSFQLYLSVFGYEESL